MGDDTMGKSADFVDEDDFAEEDESFVDTDTDTGEEPASNQPTGDSAEAIRRMEERLAAAERALKEREQAAAQGTQEAELTALEQQEAELMAKRRKALDEDDMDVFDAADKELRALERKRFVIEQRSAEAAQPQREQEAAAHEQQRVSLAPEAQAWVDRNMDWFDEGSPNYDSVRARKAKQIATELEQRFGRNNRRLYDEIDARLNRKQGMGADVAGDSRISGRSQRRGPGSLARPSKDESASMARWGFDPRKPQDVRNWRNRDADLN